MRTDARNLGRWPAAMGCLAVTLGLLLGSQSAEAQQESEFAVERAETRLRSGVYFLNAEMTLRLSDPAREALDNGVPLYFDVEMRVTRERDWWADEILAEVAQRYRLEFFELSEQFMVVNLNTGVSELFPDADTALAYIGLLVDFPLLDRVLVSEQWRYLGELRIRLDVGRLPLPLLPNAYFSSEWNLASPWYQWLLK